MDSNIKHYHELTGGIDAVTRLRSQFIRQQELSHEKRQPGAELIWRQAEFVATMEIQSIQDELKALKCGNS